MHSNHVESILLLQLPIEMPRDLGVVVAQIYIVEQHSNHSNGESIDLLQLSTQWTQL